MSIHWFLDNFVKYLITGKRNHENILVEWKRWIRQTITRKRYCGIIVSAWVQVVRRRTKLLLQSLSFTRMMKWLAHKRKHLSYVHHDKSVLGYFHRDCFPLRFCKVYVCSAKQFCLCLLWIKVKTRTKKPPFWKDLCLANR